MVVKPSQSAGRVLAVFEAIARNQPSSLTALAKELGASKSAIQRDLLTLAGAGWIQPVPDGSRRWELSLHVMSFLRPPHSSDGLRLRVRPWLERLAERCGETVYLAVPALGRFIVIDVIEAADLPRVVSALGINIALAGTATGKVWLAALPAAERDALLGTAPTPEEAAEWNAISATGYAVNNGGILPGSVTLAAALLAPGGRPFAILVVTGPRERLGPARWERIGGHLVEVAQRASQSLRLNPPLLPWSAGAARKVG